MQGCEGKTLSPKERLRYVTEEKFRKQRNIQKRQNFEENPDPTGPIIVVGAVDIGVVAWWLGKAFSPVCGPFAPACALAF
jgi:hypothetical protein